ncbi:MAG: efflux RND transporter periplasmic adaptor subunit [Polyangiaceae bacterium]
MQRTSVEVPAPDSPQTSERLPDQALAIVVIGAGAVLLIVVAVLLSFRASRDVNRVSLEASPRPVTVVPARSKPYRDTRTYVGAVEPWVEASVGPQYISAYVATVLVRPGDTVKRGAILATLDCSNPNAATRAVQMQARAADARVRASADEAARLTTMLDGGFVAPNEVEQKIAVSMAEAAQLLETKANVIKTSLDVRDCILRAPFDGEIGTRTFDPGAFVHPGAAIVSVVDRDTMRVTADASEKDLDSLAPSTMVQIEVLATGTHLFAPISRRAPRVDPKTRTIHFEIDVADPARLFPVGATAIVHVEVGKPIPAAEVPIYAATQDDGKAKLFVVEHDVAHAKTLPVIGEVGGAVYFTLTALPEGSLVVTEGRALLSDGDKVLPLVEPEVLQSGAPGDDAGAGARGGGYGRAL